MKNRGFTIIELMVVVVTIGVLAAIAIPNAVRMMHNSKEAGVKSNSHAVQVACEDFAVQNSGVYAANLTDVLPITGETIIDLLPQNQRFKNPFTGVRTEPIDGAAANQGETGYEPVVDGAGLNVGYVITGYGRSGQVCRYSNGN